MTVAGLKGLERTWRYSSSRFLCDSPSSGRRARIGVGTPIAIGMAGRIAAAAISCPRADSAKLSAVAGGPLYSFGSPVKGLITSLLAIVLLQITKPAFSGAGRGLYCSKIWVLLIPRRPPEV